jgi:hypothetical protein
MAQEASISSASPTAAIATTGLRISIDHILLLSSVHGVREYSKKNRGTTLF